MRVIYTDGATVGHNGRLGTVKEVGIGIYCKDAISISKRVKGGSNNEAEFLALIHGMEEAIRLGLKDVEFRMDSELVWRRAECPRKKNGKAYKKPKGKYKNERMDKFQDKVLELKRRFKTCFFVWIPREQNWTADELSKKASLPSHTLGRNSAIATDRINPTELCWDDASYSVKPLEIVSC